MLRRQTKKKISPDPKNLPIAQPVHQSQIFQWLNVRTQKYFQYAENSRITYPPHLSAEISFAQQHYAPNYLGPNLVAQNIQNISMPRNAKNTKRISTKTRDYTNYRTWCSTLCILSAPNKPHHGIHQLHQIFFQLPELQICGT